MTRSQPHRACQKTSENQSPATINDYRRCLYSQCRDQSASKNNLQMHLYEFETHANLYPETMGTI